MGGIVIVRLLRGKPEDTFGLPQSKVSQFMQKTREKTGNVSVTGGSDELEISLDEALHQWNEVTEEPEPESVSHAKGSFNIPDNSEDLVEFFNSDHLFKDGRLEQDERELVDHDIRNDVQIATAHIEMELPDRLPEDTADDKQEYASKVADDVETIYQFMADEGRYSDDEVETVEASSATGALDSIVTRYDLPEVAENRLRKMSHIGKAAEGLGDLKAVDTEYVGADVLIPPYWEDQVKVDSDLEKMLSGCRVKGNDALRFDHTLKKNHFDHAGGELHVRGGTYSREELEYEDQLPEDADGYIWMEFWSEEGEMPDKTPEEIVREKDDQGGLGTYLWDALVEHFDGQHFIYEKNGGYTDGFVLPYKEEDFDAAEEEANTGKVEAL